MTADETPLQMVNRHVAEGEMHIYKQRQLIEQLRTSQTADEDLLAEAEALLVQFSSTQTAHAAHLSQIREEQRTGLRDFDGNLRLS